MAEPAQVPEQAPAPVPVPVPAPAPSVTWNNYSVTESGRKADSMIQLFLQAKLIDGEWKSIDINSWKNFLWPTDDKSNNKTTTDLENKFVGATDEQKKLIGETFRIFSNGNEVLTFDQWTKIFTDIKRNYSSVTDFVLRRNAQISSGDYWIGLNQLHNYLKTNYSNNATGATNPSSGGKKKLTRKSKKHPKKNARKSRKNNRKSRKLIFHN
jgi:hypothetical protein